MPKLRYSSTSSNGDDSDTAGESTQPSSQDDKKKLVRGPDYKPIMKP
jgi:hypothetical protein